MLAAQSGRTTKAASLHFAGLLWWNKLVRASPLQQPHHAPDMRLPGHLTVLQGVGDGQRQQVGEALGGKPSFCSNRRADFSVGLG